MEIDNVNITFSRNLLKQIENMAKQESRSRSELIREAARIYLARKVKWKDICSFGDEQVINRNLKPADVQIEISRYRIKT